QDAKFRRLHAVQWRGVDSGVPVGDGRVLSQLMRRGPAEAGHYVRLGVFMKLLLGSVIVIGTVSLAAVQQAGPAGKLEIKTLSTDAALVTGGDVLVKVTAPAGVSTQSIKVMVGARDVSGVFRQGSDHAI